MSKTCLIQAATGANQWNGLGNGQSGPSLWTATDTTSGTVTLDEFGNVRVQRNGAFTSALAGAGESIFITGGTGLQPGVYTLADMQTAAIARLQGHRSMILPNRFTINYTGQPSDNDTITLGGVTYRFKTVTAQANDIFIGASATATYTSFLLALSLTGTAAGSGADYFTGTVSCPLWKSGGLVPLSAGAAGGFQVDVRIAYRTTLDPVISLANATSAGYSDLGALPPAGQVKTICTDATFRLCAARNDLWSGQGKVRDFRAMALSGTAPTIQVFSCGYVTVPGASSGPANGANDPLLAAPALALTAGLEVDLGDYIGQYGGILFRVAGTNPVVLINYD